MNIFTQKYPCSFLLFIKHRRSCDWKVLPLKNDEGGLLSGNIHKRRLSSWMILVFSNERRITPNLCIFCGLFKSIAFWRLLFAICYLLLSLLNWQADENWSTIRKSFWVLEIDVALWILQIKNVFCFTFRQRKKN